MTENKIIGKKVELWQPLIKSNLSKGQVTYEAVLSDDSVDRDDEVVGKKALQKLVDDDNFIVGLIDHENKVFNQVCEWTNKRIETRNGHTAFIAEPKFFMSNPKAKQLKGMLDEGASIGISIGAIVKDYEEKEIDGSSKRVFTDLEVLEASFVAVPANAHARITAIAKMFKNKEVKKVTEKTYTEKEFKEISEKLSDVKSELDKALKKIEDGEKEREEKSVKIDELNKALETETEKLKELQKEFDAFKKLPFDKAKSSDYSDDDGEESKKSMQEALDKGFLPVIGGN